MKYLILYKQVKLENLTILVTESKYLDQLVSEFGWTGLNFDYIDLDTKNMSKEKFDLIIANPPYGKSSSLAKEVIKQLLPVTKQSIFFTPINVYKDKYFSSRIKSYKKIPLQSFFNISITGFAIITNLSKEVVNTVSFEEMQLSDKQQELLKALVVYNEKYPRLFDIDGNCFVKKFNKRLIDCNTQRELPTCLQDICNRTLQECIAAEQVYFKPLFWVNGIPKNLLESYEGIYNYKGTWLPEWNNKRAGDLLVFANRNCRDNFRDWVYSKGSTYQSSSLCNYIRSIILVLIGSGAGSSYFSKYLPNVDWSRSWTDEEILEEIGLPRNWLEKVI